MSLKTIHTQLLTALSVCLLMQSACQSGSSRDEGHALGGEHAHGEEEAEKGPHGGRLLEKGKFALELQMFETGVPPRYRIYAYSNGKPVSPKDHLSAIVELSRLGAKDEVISFNAVDDFLLSEKEIKEPHSFAVKVDADFQGEQYSWAFESFEGRTNLSDAIAKVSGVKTEVAAPREIRTTTRIRGRILPSEDRIAHVIPRFSGVVRERRKRIGDHVQKGEVIAVVESNQSLQPFEVRSQISGTIINGHVIVGEFVPDNQWIYIVADLSEVWADFLVPLGEELEIKETQKVILSTVNGSKSSEGSISYVAPYADQQSQSQLIRATLPNSDNKLYPGMFVLGDLVVSERSAATAIKQSAIQTFEDKSVAFMKVGETYEARPLELGVSDGEWVEVLSGLSSGDEYVSDNAFLIKAHILKAGASHEH